MRKVILSFLLIGIMTTPVWAGLNFPDIDVGGELSLKSIAVNNLDCDKEGEKKDKTDRVTLTTELDLSCELSDDVAMKALIFKQRSHGAAAGNTQDLLDAKLKNCYLAISGIADMLDMTVGRQKLGDKFNALVYQSDGVDAVTMDIPCGPVGIDVIYADEDENTTSQLSCVAVSGKILDMMDVTLARYTDVDNPKNKREVVDIMLSGNLPIACGVDVSLEYAKESGKDNGNDLSGTALMLKLNSACELTMGKLLCGLTWLNTSGNDATTDEVENYAGIQPSLKLTEILSDKLAGDTINDDGDYYTKELPTQGLNAMVLNIGLVPEAVEGLSLGLAYGTYKLNEVGDNDPDDYATEINLSATYKASDAVSLKLLLAQLTPGDALSQDGDTCTKIQTSMQIHF